MNLFAPAPTDVSSGFVAILVWLPLGVEPDEGAFETISPHPVYRGNAMPCRTLVQALKQARRTDQPGILPWIMVDGVLLAPAAIDELRHAL